MYGQEDMYGEEQHEGVSLLFAVTHLQQEESNGESLNFDNDERFAHMPPLDKFRKIRRDVLQTINDLRAKFPETMPLDHDEFGNHAADEYATYLLTEDENKGTLEKICDYHNVV
jgi:hypothetical protein